MKNRIKLLVAFLACLICLWALTGCRTADAGLDRVDMGKTHTEQAGVSVRITGVVWGDDGMTLSVQWSNTTLYEAVYGSAYTIERREGDGWVSCAKAEDLAFDDIAYLLPAGGSNRENYEISRMFDVTKSGTYRFRSAFWVHHDGEDQESRELWAEFTVSSTPEQTAQIKDLGVHYIRTDGYQDGAVFPRAVVIRSRKALEDYYEANKDTFFLGRNPDPAADSTIGFLDACDGYDEAYFKEGYLVFILLEEGSGSTRHKVTEATFSSDGMLCVRIDTIQPEVGTCDMAEWHVILELSRELMVPDTSHVTLDLDGRRSTFSDIP